jgi:hypothetical protein
MPHKKRMILKEDLADTLRDITDALKATTKVAHVITNMDFEKLPHAYKQNLKNALSDVELAKIRRGGQACGHLIKLVCESGEKK